MSTEINRNEWLEALGEASKPAPDPMALTLKELAALLKLKQQAAKRRAEVLVDEGRATRVTKIVTGEDGRDRRVQAYRLKSKKK